MIKAKPVACILLLIFICSCSILDSNSNGHKIVGKWEWIRSTGGFAGITITPDSAGYSHRQLIFSNHFSFSEYRADTLSEQGLYKFAGDDEIHYKTADTNFRPNQHVRFASNDTLILQDACADCFTSTYARVH